MQTTPGTMTVSQPPSMGRGRPGGPRHPEITGQRPRRRARGPAAPAADGDARWLSLGLVPTQRPGSDADRVRECGEARATHVGLSLGPGKGRDGAAGRGAGHRCAGGPDLAPPRPGLVAVLLRIPQPSHLHSVLK